MFSVDVIERQFLSNFGYKRFTGSCYSIHQQKHLLELKTDIEVVRGNEAVFHG